MTGEEWAMERGGGDEREEVGDWAMMNPVGYGKDFGLCEKRNH